MERNIMVEKIRTAPGTPIFSGEQPSLSIATSSLDYHSLESDVLYNADPERRWIEATIVLSDKAKCKDETFMKTIFYGTVYFLCHQKQTPQRPTCDTILPLDGNPLADGTTLAILQSRVDAAILTIRLDDESASSDRTRITEINKVLDEGNARAIGGITIRPNYATFRWRIEDSVGDGFPNMNFDKEERAKNRH
ncbi:uncharacterized protein KY384_008181 [Bacidia gigantensis]|uniref:uncharacterized protein n=1 Tax=Bacidia gigantensis TaxID=2732470 RepID=UPI001D04D83B|nr:uncharacterized protein KY384_008181 [Bacidia gigantensis]KAG8526752.1 hypothetical protein KY384_008181 [Bacidia gigantensis]